jgi:hypothetical protein
VTESSGFFGVTSMTPITEVTFFSDCSSLLSNLSLVTPAPEPDSLGLMLVGLGFLAIVARRGRAWL